MIIPEVLEKRLTIIFAFIGLAAIVINLVVYEDDTWSGVLSAVESASALLITVLVFLVASKIASRMDYDDFRKVFEEDLRSWVEQNRFLIDEEKRVEGKDNREYYFMLTKAHHANFVLEEKPARDFDTKRGASTYHKGAFLYCDYSNEEVITFGLNKSFFVSGPGGDMPVGFTDLPQIAALIRDKLQAHFGSKFRYMDKSNTGSLDITITSDGRRIHISLKNLENTRATASLLIDMIEYVKTIILTIA